MPVFVLTFFIFAATRAIQAVFALASDLKSPPAAVLLGLKLSSLLIAFGGILEGVLTESSFLQWTHLLAILFIFAGSLWQGYPSSTLQLTSKRKTTTPYDLPKQ